MSSDDETPAERPGRKHSSQRALNFASVAEQARDRFLASGNQKKALECAQLATRLREWRDVPPGDEERNSAIVRLLKLDGESREM